MRLLPRLLLVVTLLPAGARAASVVRGPFLQQTAPDSTLVVVDTDTPASVEAIADLPGGGTARAHSEGTHHLLRLQGLPEASRVPYRLTVDGVERPGGKVHTPGRPGTAAGRRAVLAVVGDFGTGEPVEYQHVGRMIEDGVDAVLTVGDNALPDATTTDFLERVFEPFAPLLPSATMWPIAGDHEYEQPYARPYFDAFELPEGDQGEHYYSFDWGDLHVVALDSNCIVPLDAATAGCDTKTMAAWLERDLAATRAPWRVALVHRPALATGKYGVYPQIPAALVPLFEKHSVDLVLQGHNHLYERSWPTLQGKPVKKDYDHPGAPVYVTTGGAGGWLYDFVLPAAEWTAYREKTDQRLLLTLEDGRLRVDSIRGDAIVHDTFTIVKDLPPLPDAGTAGAGGDGVSVGGGGTTPEEPAVVADPATIGCQSGNGGSALLLPAAALAVAAAFWRRRRS